MDQRILADPPAFASVHVDALLCLCYKHKYGNTRTIGGGERKSEKEGSVRRIERMTSESLASNGASRASSHTKRRAKGQRGMLLQ